MQLINNNTGSLTTKISDDSFNFYGKILNGNKKRKSQTKRSILLVNNIFGFDIGKQFVKQNYNKNKENFILELIENIKCVFENRIKNLDWMTSSTKKKAILKLRKISNSIS